MTANKKIIHGSSVALQGPDFKPSAVLLRGFSGRGKSDLAFRLISLGGTLICDDQVALEHRLNKIMVESVPAIHGLLEIRGVGLIKCPVAPPTPLCLVVDLVPREEVPRLPEKGETVDILGVDITFLKLHAFDASTPHKIIKAIELVHKPDLLV
jgi:HPr kinase/phosphorylase